MKSFKLSLLGIIALFVSMSALSQTIINGRGGTVYQNPGYYVPYVYPQHRYFKPVVVPPHAHGINSCPLKPSYYDAKGNWIPPKRVCSSQHS